MNTEQTCKNVFTYIKTLYGENILAKIRKLKKTMIKCSSYTNYLRFSLRCHHNKILAQLWEKYLSELSLIKHICSWRDKLIVL